MRQVTDEYEDSVLLGEVYLPIGELVSYYGLERSGAHLPFNFHLISLPWEARRLQAAIDEYEASLRADSWPNWVLGNHDKRRVATRVGIAQARVAAFLLLTLRGTPTLYYGDEIGMTDVDIPPERRPGVATFDRSGRYGRLPHRTPMRWDGAPYSGFSTAEPWLPIGPAGDVNVADQQCDGGSMLALHRNLLSLRRSTPALVVGSYAPVPLGDASVITYVREHNGERFLIALNLADAVRQIEPPHLLGEVLISTHLDRAGEVLTRQVELRPNEGLAVRVSELRW